MTEETEESHRGPRHDDIIDAAIEVFSRTNYDKATTAMIAREAGVAEGTLYKYFPNKKELFLACVRYVEQSLIARYAALYEELKDQPLAYLHKVGNSYFDWLKENPNQRKFLAFVLNNSFDEDFKAELENFFSLNVATVERMLQRAIDRGEIEDINARLAAWIFVGGYFTLILMFELDAKEFQQEDIMDEVMRFLLR